MRIVSEDEFQSTFSELLLGADLDLHEFGAVTGPGRSGAVAAVYASHLLRIPFIPFGQLHPQHLGRLLIVDTAQESGRTIRKALRKYRNADPKPLVAFNEPPRVAFWYEACNPKPQRFRHECTA